MFKYITFIIKSNFRKLTHKKAVVPALLTLLLVFTFVIYSKKKIRMEMKKENLNKCLEFINGAVDHCLKLKERKAQNQRFAAIRTTFPIKPLKMTLTTAVFHYKQEKQNFVIKRVMVRDESPTSEDIISMSLKHPNIIKTYETRKSTFTDHKGVTHNILWLFSELLKIKITQRYVNRNEDTIRFIMKDIVEAIRYMHVEMDMIHLDLKMANVMGNTIDGVPRYIVLDLGYSRCLTTDGVKDEIKIPGKAYGTFPYKPPEVVFENVHGKCSDIYCIGAIAWFMILGETPFYDNEGEKDTVAHRKFLRGKTKHFYRPGTSNEIKDFIEKCMNLDRKKRPTIQELLKHPFLNNETLSSSSSVSDDLSDYNDFSDSGYASESIDSAEL